MRALRATQLGEPLLGPPDSLVVWVVPAMGKAGLPREGGRGKPSKDS